MAFGKTTAYYKIKALKKRVRVIQGGSSGGKTIAILIQLIEYATANKGKLITIAAANYPHLRRGAMRDFKNILDENNLWNYYKIEHNKAESTFTFYNGSTIEFVALNEFTARGSRRDVLFVNEANLITFETFQQLEIRTKDFVIIDFNPVNKFWAHKLIEERSDTEFLKLTYLDNEGLDKAIVDSIEARKDGDSNWWRVYGLGEIGSLDGNVYSGWKPVDKIPDGFKLAIVGGDWGFAKDPTAIVGIYVNEAKELLFDEWFYAPKVNDEDVGRIVMADHPEAAGVMAALDAANPQGIMRWRDLGWQSFAASKPAGSVIAGVNFLRQRTVYYTARSKNLEKEYLTYAFVISKSTGESTGVPIDKDNHLMDALRYGTSALANMRRL